MSNPIASTEDNHDSEIILTHGDLKLTVSPYGASMRGLSRTGNSGAPDNEIVTGYHGATGKVGGQGDVLIPFPGRIPNGAYVFGGERHQLELTDKEGPNAIHGFLRRKMWRSTPTSSSVAFETDIAPEEFAGYPFSLHVGVTYTLTDTCLSTTYTITNTGSTPAPVAAGFHPYFTVGSSTIDADVLSVSFDSVLEFDEGLLPTGRVLPVEGSPLDFRAPRKIGDVKFNTCYAIPNRDPDGFARILLAADGASSVTVAMDQAFAYVVLYSGDPLPESHRRRSLAIEPMTCATDAFNHPEWGLVALPPQEVFTGTWRVEVG